MMRIIPILIGGLIIIGVVFNLRNTIKPAPSQISTPGITSGTQTKVPTDVLTKGTSQATRPMMGQESFGLAVCEEVSQALVEKIVGKPIVEVKDHSDNDTTGCEYVTNKDTLENVVIVVAYLDAENQKKFYEQKDFECFEFWVKNYITNWATCDTFCTKNMGFFLEKFPEYCQNIKRWSSSKRRWDRRASAVSFIRLSRGIEFLDTIFEITDTLLTDKDDMVQKGYGWLLKETSKHHLELVFNYVMSNKSKMPRTALRYAIEKMPLDLKKEAMLK